MIARTVRTALTFGVLVLALLLGLVWGWTALTAPFPELGKPEVTEAPQAVCENRTLNPGDTITPRDVAVSVFNAGTRDGMATEVMGALAKRDFGPGETGNAPDSVDVRDVEVWGEEDNPAVFLVAQQFGQGTRVVPPRGTPLGPGVVVVVGDEFRGLRGEKSEVHVRARATICSPTSAR
jgi:hypothetical protein